MSRPFRRTAFTAAAVVGCLVLASPAAAAPGLQVGFMQIDFPATVQAGDGKAMLENARSAGASVWRFQLQWAAVATAQPPDAASARDPAWTGYRWDAVDRYVREITAAGLQPLPFFGTAPAWAEGTGRPSSDEAPRGTWRPSPEAFGAFVTAAARRYSGSFADPQIAGSTLPRIRHWQTWNEPNLSVDLTPQWVRSGGRWRAESPRIYRSLQNAAYAALKAVSPSNVVVSAGTAPYGDLNPGDPRIPPARWWRELLCVSGRAKLTAKSCAKVSFDAVAHHPYPIGPPRRKARNPDDVVVPDLAKITRVVEAARRKRTIVPNKAKPLWITEISWDSRPDPDGLSQDDQAQYLAGALNVLWRQGADVITWFNVRDQAPRPSFDTTYQSGVFERGATPAQDTRKPSFTAFRFPFTAYRSEGVARLWGLSPAGAGEVVIEAQQGGRWVTATRVRAGSNRVFEGRLRVGPNVRLRARVGEDTSLSWRTF